MHINWWTLALQAINALILIWLLSRFLYRPIVAAIAARQAAADKLLAEAGAAKEAAVAAQEALKARDDAFASDAEHRRAEAQAAADAERNRLLEAARQDAAHIREQAEAALAAERETVAKEFAARAAILAGDMAYKLVERLPNVLVQQAMFEALTERVAAMPAADQAALCADGPLELLTARPLDETGRAQCREALASSLPSLPGLVFSEDAALIGGCELHGANIHVGNSWRADLDAMLGRIKDDDHDRDA